ncbi:MAG: hypothetical protein Q9195_005086 [Heterodermia aff. obscurata]
MSVEHPSAISRNSVATLRPRTRRQAHDDGADESYDETLFVLEPCSRPSSQSRSSFTDTSTIPNQHPSRPTTALRDHERSSGNNRPSISQGLFGGQTLPSTFATGLWESSWTSLQGIASNFLSNDAHVIPSTSGSTNRKRRPHEFAKGSKPKARSGQWGPQGTEERLIGAGTKEDRLAKLQAKKRERLLAANGHIHPDSSGRFKRRDSDERASASAPPSQPEDREALVYLHKVKPEDTLAGVMIKYNCNAPVFRKANRLWPNDRIQIRKVVFLPIDACGIQGRKLADEEMRVNGFSSIVNDDLLETPTAVHAPWDPSPNPSEASENVLSSVATSPSISVSPPDEDPWTHDSWMSLPNFSNPVEVARLSRRSLGFFPPSRRKSVSFSDLDTPSVSLDLPRDDGRNNSRRREKDRSGSSSGSYFADRLQGPGGVGTLGREVRSPGPAQDGLNKLFAAHLPNVAPRASFESAHSNSSHGIENVGGAIEGWMRKIANKAKESVQPPSHGSKSAVGDLIELSDTFELADDNDRRGTERAGDDADVATQPPLGTWKDDQERLLRERFPPRGRVFAESPRRKGV